MRRRPTSWVLPTTRLGLLAALLPTLFANDSPLAEHGGSALEPPSDHRGDAANSIVERLNGRFLRGRPSNQMTEVGVVMRQADQQDSGLPWAPSQAKWITKNGFNDRLSSSILSARLPFAYSNTAVGLVLEPAALERGNVVACACPRDCGTFAFAKHVPLAQQCAGVNASAAGLRSHIYLAANLSRMLHAHEDAFLHERASCTRGTHSAATARDRNGCRYNEVLLSASALERALPDAVEAMFYPVADAAEVDHSEGSPAAARKVREAFERAYGVHRPLVAFDVREARHGRPPFALDGGDVERA